jgi:hypothetical protein
MTNHPNRANVKFDSVIVKYFSDGRNAYWTEQFDDGGPCPFSANRYATFHGLDSREGRQVHGPHSSPLMYDDPRQYFLQRPGFATRRPSWFRGAAKERMNFEVVSSLNDLRR